MSPGPCHLGGLYSDAQETVEMIGHKQGSRRLQRSTTLDTEHGFYRNIKACRAGIRRSRRPEIIEGEYRPGGEAHDAGNCPKCVLRHGV